MLGWVNSFPHWQLYDGSSVDSLDSANRIVTIYWSRAVVGDLCHTQEAELTGATSKLLDDTVHWWRFGGARLPDIAFGKNLSALVAPTSHRSRFWVAVRVLRRLIGCCYIQTHTRMK